MDELDEIEALEHSAEKMMNEKPATRSRQAESAVVEEDLQPAPTTPGALPPAKAAGAERSAPPPGAASAGQGAPPGDGSTQVDELYRQILERLDRLPDGIVYALKKGEAMPPPRSGGFWPWRSAPEPEPEDEEDFASLDNVRPNVSEEEWQRRHDAATLLKAVEDRVFGHAMTHHSSVVVLIGWAFALLSVGMGMSWGYIAGTAKFPAWWPKPGAGLAQYLAATFLNAPVGILLLPVSGYILWRIAGDMEGKKGRGAMRALSVLLIVAGIALPFVGLL